MITYNTIKDLLSFKPTQKQLRQRIWELKHKFENMKKDEDQNFLPRSSTTFENKIFDISHMIRGQDNEENKENTPKKEELESAFDKEKSVGAFSVS